MWEPATGLDWQVEGLCALPANKAVMGEFFSQDTEEKYDAKNMCFSCPERASCLQWALEHRQLWGIWGGKDEVEIRRALSVSYSGEEMKRRRPPHCPYCAARPDRLAVSVETIPGGGRWKHAKVVTCSDCGFAWRSRTSANAVELYQQERRDRQERALAEMNHQHSQQTQDWLPQAALGQCSPTTDAGQ